MRKAHKLKKMPFFHQTDLRGRNTSLKKKKDKEKERIKETLRTSSHENPQ